MNSAMRNPVAIRSLAFSAVLAVMGLNLLLRTVGKLSGLVATLAVAALTGAGIRLWVRLRYQRNLYSSERWRVLGLYSAVLALLYIGLLLSMALQNDPSPMAVLIFGLHYFCYPLLAWLITRPSLPHA
jgi:drug/metabolite transporter (DMT)-like permease